MRNLITNEWQRFIEAADKRTGMPPTPEVKRGRHTNAALFAFLATYVFAGALIFAVRWLIAQ
jgi:hypothetical protein